MGKSACSREIKFVKEGGNPYQAWVRLVCGDNTICLNEFGYDWNCPACPAIMTESTEILMAVAGAIEGMTLARGVTAGTARLTARAAAIRAALLRAATPDKWASGKAAQFNSLGLKLFNSACSFTGNTKILMADSTTKPIKDIKVGDEVLATNPETGVHGPRTVTHLWLHDNEIVNLRLADGSHIETTEDHPFCNSTAKQWQQAQQLNPVQLMYTADGSAKSATGVDRTTGRLDTAYDLTVVDVHTYYVAAGDTFVLVHNCNTMTARDLVKTRTSHPIDQDYIRELDEQLTDDEFFKWLNEPNDGDFVLMTRDGTLVGGHHRLYYGSRQLLPGQGVVPVESGALVEPA